MSTTPSITARRMRAARRRRVATDERPARGRRASASSGLVGLAHKVAATGVEEGAAAPRFPHCLHRRECGRQRANLRRSSSAGRLGVGPPLHLRQEATTSEKTLRFRDEAEKGARTGSTHSGDAAAGKRSPNARRSVGSSAKDPTPEANEPNETPARPATRPTSRAGWARSAGRWTRCFKVARDGAHQLVIVAGVKFVNEMKPVLGRKCVFRQTHTGGAPPRGTLWTRLPGGAVGEVLKKSIFLLAARVGCLPFRRF